MQNNFLENNLSQINYGGIAFLKIKMLSGKIIKHHNIKLKFPHSLIRDN